MGTKLYVGNLSFQTSSKELQDVFEEGGTVKSASVVEGRDTRRARLLALREGHRDGIPVKISVGSEGGATVQGRAILDVRKQQASERPNDKEAYQQAQPYFAEIADSRKRSRKMQADIGRIKKKTQAIIDKLP